MVTNSLIYWRLRIGSFLAWALAAASVVFWTLRVVSPTDGAVVAVADSGVVSVDSQAVALALGAGSQQPVAAAAATSSRYTLQGLLAGRDSGLGAAVIAVNGQAAKAFPVGSEVDQGLVLQSVGVQQARLGPSREGNATLTLELPLKK